MDKNNSKVPYMILGAMGVMLVISVIWKLYNQKLLEGPTKKTFGIITDITSGRGVRQIPEVEYRYSVNKRNYSDSDNGNFNAMKIGDTILIKYSVTNHSVSEVVDKHYMKKYQNK